VTKDLFIYYTLCQKNPTYLQKHYKTRTCQRTLCVHSYYSSGNCQCCYCSRVKFL